MKGLERKRKQPINNPNEVAPCYECPALVYLAFHQRDDRHVIFPARRRRREVNKKERLKEWWQMSGFVMYLTKKKEAISCLILRQRDKCVKFTP